MATKTSRHARNNAQAILASLLAKSDDRDVRMRAIKQRLRPSPEWRVALGDMGQRRSRAVNQQLAQIFVAALADAEQLRFAAGRELPWNQTEPGGEIATAIEAFRLTDGGDERRGDRSRRSRGSWSAARATSFSFAQLTNSASNAAIRRSSSSH